MESLKTIIGLALVFLGLGLFSFKSTYQSAPILGAELLIVGIIFLFTKRGVDTKGSSNGWHMGNSGAREDD